MFNDTLEISAVGLKQSFYVKQKLSSMSPCLLEYLLNLLNTFLFEQMLSILHQYENDLICFVSYCHFLWVRVSVHLL